MADTLDLPGVDLHALPCPRCAAALPASVRFYGPCPDCTAALRAEAADAARRNAPDATEGAAGEDADRPLQGQERAMNG